MLSSSFLQYNTVIDVTVSNLITGIADWLQVKMLTDLVLLSSTRINHIHRILALDSVMSGTPMIYSLCCSESFSIPVLQYNITFDVTVTESIAWFANKLSSKLLTD